MVNGPGTVILIGLLGHRAQMLDIAHLHRLRAADLTDDARHDLAGLVAALDLGGVVDVDAVERGRRSG